MFVITVMACLVTGCGTTSAPTESSSNTLDKSLDVIMDATSSTSPGHDRGAATEFTRTHFARIKMEMAAGGGEHLQALATILGVAREKQPCFFVESRHNFSSLAGSSQATPEQLVTALAAEVIKVTENSGDH